MKCSMCNAEATPDAAFCGQCGAKLPAPEARWGQSESAGASSAASDSTASYGARGRDVPEEVLWEGSYSPKAMLGAGVGAVLLSIVLLIVAIGFVTNNYLRMVIGGVVVLLWFFLAFRLLTQRLGVHYKLTNQMFYHRSGVLTRTTDRVELIEVHDVTWTQGLFERLVNVGTIKIDSSDRTHHVLRLPGIDDVEDVAKTIDKARRGEQVRRGRRIESIGVPDGG